MVIFKLEATYSVQIHHRDVENEKSLCVLASRTLDCPGSVTATDISDDYTFDRRVDEGSDSC